MHVWDTYQVKLLDWVVAGQSATIEFWFITNGDSHPFQGAQIDMVETLETRARVHPFSKLFTYKFKSFQYMTHLIPFSQPTPEMVEVCLDGFRSHLGLSVSGLWVNTPCCSFG